MDFNNAIIKTTPDEINSFVMSLWKTQEMRDLHQKAIDGDGSSFLYDVMKGFSKIPRIFASKSSGNNDIKKYENSHFYTWMNAIQLRDYQGYPDAINDVYYLHEIWHAGTLVDEYDPFMPWDLWYEKMGLNELHASIASEVLIYKVLPRSFREKSFKFRLWYDILEKEAETLGIESFEDFSKFVLERRMMAMRMPNPYCFQELQISNYANQNYQWALIWRENYKIVESMMQRFIASTNITSANKYSLAKNYITKLSKTNASPSGFAAFVANTIPFYAEAEKFYEITQESSRKFGNHLLE